MEQHSILNENEPAISQSQNNKQVFERRDYVFLLLSLAVGFAFCEFILFGGLGVGVPLFFLIFYPVAAVYLSGSHHVFSKTSMLTFFPVLILLLCFVLFDNVPLRLLNIIALWICVMLNLLAMSGLESHPLFFAGTFFDIIKITFYTPFYKLGKCINSLFGSFKKSRRRNIGIVLLTLIGISPVVMIVLFLLSSSDAGFERIFSSFINLLTGKFWLYFWKIIISVLLTFPLFNLLYALKNQKRQEKHPSR